MRLELIRELPHNLKIDKIYVTDMILNCALRCASGRIRTYDQWINSPLLYHWATEALFIIHYFLRKRDTVDFDATFISSDISFTLKPFSLSSNNLFIKSVDTPIYCDTGETPTPNLLIRSQLFYAVELQCHFSMSLPVYFGLSLPTLITSTSSSKQYDILTSNPLNDVFYVDRSIYLNISKNSFNSWPTEDRTLIDWLWVSCPNL